VVLFIQKMLDHWMIKSLEKLLLWRFLRYFLLIYSGFLFLYVAIDCCEKSMQGLQGILVYAGYHFLFLLFDRFSFALFSGVILWFQAVWYYGEWEKFLLLQGSFLVFIRPVLFAIMSLGMIFSGGYYFLYDYCLEARLTARGQLIETKKKNSIVWSYEPQLQCWIRAVSGMVDRSIIPVEVTGNKKIFLFQVSIQSLSGDASRKQKKMPVLHEVFGVVIIPLFLSLLSVFFYRFQSVFVMSSFILYAMYWGGVSFFETEVYWWDGLWIMGFFVLGVIGSWGII
jgi:hypothetical protein